MRNVWKISDNHAIVEGAKRCAVYCFKTGIVASISSEDSALLRKYAAKGTISDEELLKVKDFTEKLSVDRICWKEYPFPEPSPPILRQAWLELTLRCTHKCIHCYEGDTHCDKNGNISYEKWCSIIDELSELNCQRLQFTGGEPCLYERLPELIDHAVGKHFSQLELFTNLSFLSDELTDRIIRYGVKVKTSVYGSTAEVHDRITSVKGSFERTMGNIRRLLKLGVIVMVNVVIMKETEADMDNIPAMLKNNGVTKIHYDEIREVRDGLLGVHSVEHSRISSKPNLHTDRSSFEMAHSFNRCFSQVIAVSNDGRVFPCVMYRDHSYGNVTKDSLSNILNSQSYANMRDLGIDKVNICRDCEFRYACSDCRTRARKFGGIHEKYYRCKYDPYNGNWNK